MKKSKSVLLKNTIMLYLLIFSNYALSFVTVPYQTRILSPEKYGVIGLAVQIMAYFQLIVDFGFLISATADVSKVRDDNKMLSQIFTAVTWVKIALSAFSFVALCVICRFVPAWSNHFPVLMFYLIGTILNSLIPDYLYRGLEKMETITIRTVLIKVFFTVMVFFCVKKPEDYILIPVLQIVGNGIALLAVYIHMQLKLNVHFVVTPVRTVFRTFLNSLSFFISRIATTVYAATNTVVLDLVCGGVLTAYYATANQLVTAARSGMSPIADSLYPYMIRNKDFRLVKKILIYLEPIIILGCTVLFILAKPICLWLFGSEYGQTAAALRALLPVVVFTLPNYTFGFPVLGAMGLSKYVNYSTLIGAIVHIIGLILLGTFYSINLVTLGVMTSITEFVILSYRVAVVIKFRKSFQATE